MTDPVQQPASSKDGLPFVDDLLSERSRTWVEERLRREAQAQPDETGLRASIGSFQPRIGGYVLGDQLGRGGMGTVYACTKEGLADRLAIKIITSGAFAADEERRRFKSEIGVLLRLHHPNLSRLRDFGQEGAVAWFVMDFIDGRSFHDWLKHDKPNHRQVAALLGHAARAIAHAHRQGIVHRDLNPSNVMVLADASPVVMDFGLARDLSSDEILTITGTTVGTPPYMAPEQTLGSQGRITHQTDIWGLGGILFHALVGRPPFEGASNHEIFTAINETDVVLPSSLVAGVPKDLERICLRCLQRVPGDRYDDMDALAADLEGFAAGRRIGVQLPGLFTRMRRKIRHRPLPWALAAGLVAISLGFGGYAAVEQIRRWATWSVVEKTVFDHGWPLPQGLAARDGALIPLVNQPVPVPGGLGPVEPVPGQQGWWWLERPGLQGGVRLEFEMEMPVSDAVEVVLNAAPDRPREWWHHPAGWSIKLSSSNVMSLAIAYRDKPGPLPTDNGFLLDPIEAGNGRIGMAIEVRETSCTVTLAGRKPVTVSDPLALGGSDRRAIAIRFFGAKTRLKQLRVDRLAVGELVSPLAGPDALLRHGRSQEAVAEYRLIAKDHARTSLGSQALLRAFGELCRQRQVSDEERFALYDELLARGPGPYLDDADRMRAIALWGRGHAQLALGVARDLVARRPDLNPAQAFLGDRSWSIPDGAGLTLLRLFAQSPHIAGIVLPELGLTDLAPIAGRRAWSVNITGNAISDLTPLAGCGATTIYAGRNHISDLGPVASIPSLTRLVVLENQITSLAPLSVLTSLTSIDAGQNHIASLRGLPDSLTDVVVNRNPIIDLAGLPVANLAKLGIAATQVTDLSLLTGAAKLGTLDISDTATADLQAIGGLPIAELRLSGCRQMAVGGVKRLPNLHVIVAQRMGLTSLDPLRAPLAASLTSVDLSDNPLTSWPVCPAPHVRELYLNRCPLSDIAGLATLEQLERLELRGCNVTDARPLASLLHLNRLDLRDNRLTSLDGLLNAPPATFLVMGNPLSQATCEALIAAGRRLKRYDLVVQGSSILAAARRDPGLIRQYALAGSGRSFAVLLTAEPCSESQAEALAAAAGARLAVIGDPALNAALAGGLGPEADAWMGVQLRSSNVVDGSERPVGYVALMPPLHYRGYRALPSDGGRIALMTGGIWGLCLKTPASGVILEWDDLR